MADKILGNNAIKQLQWGMHTAIINGEIVRDIPSELILVKNTTERNQFTNTAHIGTIAATYGFGSMWQLNSDRQWVNM